MHIDVLQLHKKLLKISYTASLDGPQAVNPSDQFYEHNKKKKNSASHSCLFAPWLQKVKDKEINHLFHLFKRNLFQWLNNNSFKKNY